ncbi:hypothetical protein [Myroides odoratus]|uniref:Uncharacterized protein n=1 Tax=Myroides odoratus TaxID=256 RepID=A0A9Q6Z633_MYROD|nr:hypothetical protein [Myroides odoratus]EHQ41784.1 hypothetical protein Myrod_0949 [Myroides odoratus DSM 2801]EKB08987.1 hypothetical protein HMPREF9716_00494 [Myroides odoratus CIP 103059]QQT99186.1 hypothetical protein I6I88_13325 [Myroides odoratus]WQD58616.1 hypothetical protein U0010_05635 [Myroides odoratus]STZ29045.1 Uncharacterised protein [Myroides odoratus]
MNLKEKHFITLKREKLTEIGYRRDTIFEIDTIDKDIITISDAASPFYTYKVNINDIEPIEANSDLAKNLALDVIIMASFIPDGHSSKDIKRNKEPFMEYLTRNNHDISKFKYVHEFQDNIPTNISHSGLRFID